MATPSPAASALCWRKHGLIFDTDVHKAPWYTAFGQAPATLVFDDFVRVYFSARPAPDANGQFTSRSGWLDLDRRDLRTILRISQVPALELGDTGTFDEFGTYPMSVCREGSEVIAFYAGWTRCESVPFDVAIGRAVSTDGGETFVKDGPGPALGYSLNEPFVISGPKIRRFNGGWQLFYIAGSEWVQHEGRPEPVYRLRLATSTDGRHWHKLDRDLVPIHLEGGEAQASPDVIYRNGRYHMFFCYRHVTDYRNSERGYRIGYAVSDDMLNWTRDDARAGMDVSESGWDSEMVAYPHVFELDGRIFMMYLGDGVGRRGFGLAELEGDL